jgi:protein Mpv17
MVTGGILWSVGDAVAQLVPPLTHGQALSTIRYDWARTGRAGFFGFAIHAPTSHLHFNFLEWMTVQSGFTGLQIPVFKAFMEQFVYWSWISNSMYHAAMGAMQGMNLEQIVRRIEDVLWDTQKVRTLSPPPLKVFGLCRHRLDLCASRSPRHRLSLYP